MLGAERIGNLVPLLDGGRLVLLREDGLQHRRDRGAVLRADMGEDIPGPVNAAPLLGRAEDALRGGPEALVVVGDDEPHPAQPAVGERAEKVGPEGLRLRRAGGDAEHLAPPVQVHADGHYHGAADDPPVLAHLQVVGVEPEIRPAVLDRPRQESLHPLVDLGTKPADLAFGDAGAAHCADEVVDGTRRDAMHVRLLE